MQPSYAASPSTIVITLSGLTNGSWRQSAFVDNTIDLFEDAMIGGSLQMGTNPVAPFLAEFYLYGSYDGTHYTAGASGLNAAYTADGEELLFPKLRFIQVDATSDQDYVWGPVSVRRAASWSKLPPFWGIIHRNNTGVAYNAVGTNNHVKFTGVKWL